MTQSQAQARQPGGAASKTHLSQRARRHAGKTSNSNGPARLLFKFYKSSSTDLSSPGPENLLHSNAITRTRIQDTPKFRRTYPTAEG